MKKLSGLFAVGSALLLGGVAHAQGPGAPAGGPPPAGVTVVNETTIPGQAPMVLDAPESGTMPPTGGAPIAMALSGILAAGGAFFARRKLS